MRILFINDNLPYPPISGDQIRVYNLIRRIARHHEVVLAAVVGPDENDKAAEHMREFCFRVETGIKRPRHQVTYLPGFLRSLIAGIPLEFSVQYSRELATKIRDIASKMEFDIVHVEQSLMAPYMENLPLGGHYKSILALQNIASQQFGKIARINVNTEDRLRSKIYSWQMSHWEPRCAGQFDECVTVSEPDRRLLLAANADLHVEVVPNGVDTHKYQPLAIEDISQPSVLLIGSMSYAPCVDAALYFCNQILPRIQRALGKVQLWIVGANPVPEVVALAGENVHVTGRVEDVVPYYQRCAVSVVPLRAGGGTRLKILEAMALGRPVVSTSIGCEGLEVRDGEHLLIADKPEAFAAKVVQLITDVDMYRRLTTIARELVVTHYDWDAIASHLLQLYVELVDPSNILRNSSTLLTQPTRDRRSFNQ
jgi:sugar transferase (PEP-CTERM/EpsH1 system associated)